MKDWKSLCKKLLHPPLWLIMILAVISAASLIAVFLNGWDTSPVAYAIYVDSFYSLTVLCIFCIGVFPNYYRKIKKKIYDNKFGNRYFTDVAFKTHISLYLSLAINMLYVALNLFSGIWYGSVWSITLAAYYIILAVMRFLLLRFVSKTGIGKDRIRELRRSRLCAGILMTLNVVLSGVVILVIVQNKGFEYAGILIYVMAMYTFYVTTISVVDIIKYRKYNSPIMSTAKVINLAAALVSMLSLETAMLTQFATENTSPYFDKIMIGATGAGVSVILVVISIYIIVRANKEIRKFNNSKT